MVSRVDFPEAAARAEALSARTSLGVGGRPEFLFEPAAPDEAQAVVQACNERGVPLHFLGGGYNLLVHDTPIPGAVIASKWLRDKQVTAMSVSVGAGYPFPRLVRESIELSIPVLPGCPGIPGTVGGCVAMNAGGRFGDIGDALLSVLAIDAQGELLTHTIQPGDMSYRSSPFTEHMIVEATFRRDLDLDPAEQQALFEEALDWKRATQPLGARSAGCIFKNPPGDKSAGRLIDEAGLKGHTIGGAMVSPVHANFIENAGGATCADIEALIDHIRSTIHTRTGITLELEVRSW